MDEFFVIHKVLWTTNFVPPTSPGDAPIVLGLFNQVDPIFNLVPEVETIIRGPGEYDVELDTNILFEVSVEVVVSELQFNIPFGMSVFTNTTSDHFEFVFSNRWKKEIMGEYAHVSGVDGDYRVALMRNQFIFDPDIHEYYEDQIDAYEIVSENGYYAGIPIVFADMSDEGILSFQDCGICLTPL